MPTVKISDQNVKNFFNSTHSAINIKKFCEQADISYDSFRAFLGGNDKRYHSLSLRKLNLILPIMYHYGFKAVSTDPDPEPTEEEIFLADNEQVITFS